MSAAQSASSRVEALEVMMKGRLSQRSPLIAKRERRLGGWLLFTLLLD